MISSADFIGPLDRATQTWCDEVFEVDCVTALSEPVNAVIERRLAAIAGYHRTVAALLLAGDLPTAKVIAFGAVAESRALAAFRAISPSYAHDRDWHRFGS
jgi:hypothetical protein